jgi:hypothetical protein
MSVLKKPLGTIKRGKVKILSEKQMAYLHFKHLPHTDYVYKDSKVIKKRHTY